MTRFLLTNTLCIFPTHLVVWSPAHCCLDCEDASRGMPVIAGNCQAMHTRQPGSWHCLHSRMSLHSKDFFVFLCREEVVPGATNASAETISAASAKERKDMVEKCLPELRPFRMNSRCRRFGRLASTDRSVGQGRYRRSVRLHLRRITVEIDGRFGS